MQSRITRHGNMRNNANGRSAPFAFGTGLIALRIASSGPANATMDVMLDPDGTQIPAEYLGAACMIIRFPRLTSTFAVDLQSQEKQP
jgi:hypothetical protein